MNKPFTALSIVLALAACGEEEAVKNTQVTDYANSDWDTQYVVDLQDIEVVLPGNRLFHLDATAFVPSVITENMSAKEYTEAARAAVQDKAQYYVDIYACRGHGDTFYASMPTSTPEAELPFTSATTVDEVNPDVLFSIENMQTRYENFGNDEFTVNHARHIGERKYSHEEAMKSYIAEGRGNHRPQEPTCSGSYIHNPRGPAPQ